MALSHGHSPMLLSGRSPAGERRRADYIPELSFLLVLASCTTSGDHVGCFEDSCLVRGMVAEMLLFVAPSMEMAVVAVVGSQLALYRSLMVAVLAVPIGLDWRDVVPVVAAVAAVSSQLVLYHREMAPVVPIEDAHTVPAVAAVEAADS
jgi:uncharacterized membrane protein (UPF0136 family)